MKSQIKPTLYLTLFLLIIISAAGCGGGDNKTSSDSLTPCNLDFDQVGEYVQVEGTTMFVDDTAPDELYADLEFNDCRVGISISKATFEKWSEEEQKAFNVDSKIIVTGYLESVPMPFSPDEEQLIIYLDTAPEILDGAEAKPIKLEDTVGDPCLFSTEMVGKDVSAVGKIIFVDDSTAAGLYAEMESGDCVYRLWVERTRWNTWSEEEQEAYSPGSAVEVYGILTIVLNEQNIDLSVPPKLEDN